MSIYDRETLETNQTMDGRIGRAKSVASVHEVYSLKGHNRRGRTSMRINSIQTHMYPPHFNISRTRLQCNNNTRRALRQRLMKCHLYHCSAICAALSYKAAQYHMVYIMHKFIHVVVCVYTVHIYNMCAHTAGNSLYLRSCI